MTDTRPANEPRTEACPLCDRPVTSTLRPDGVIEYEAVQAEAASLDVERLREASRRVYGAPLAALEDVVAEYARLAAPEQEERPTG